MARKSSARVYLYDIQTRREIAAGYVCEGIGAYGVREGIKYTDTTVSLEISDRGAARTLTAADFPGRLVCAKIWRSNAAPEWRFLAPSELFASATEARGATRTAVLGRGVRALLAAVRELAAEREAIAAE